VNQASQWDEILVMSTSFILSNAKHGKMHAVNLDMIDHQTYPANAKFNCNITSHNNRYYIAVSQM